MKILAVGNELREDDAIAIEIASEINAVKAYTLPECYIKEGDEIIIVDAIDFKAKPGNVKLFNKEELVNFLNLSTHMNNTDLLSKLCKKIHYIGIQPASLSFKEGISEELKKSREEIIKKVKEIIKSINK